MKKIITSPYFYIPAIIAAVILIWFWIRAIQCKWQCNFWTGKPKANLPATGPVKKYEWDTTEKRCYQIWEDGNKTWVADNNCAGH